jgi:hypothetical protein
MTKLGSGLPKGDANGLAAISTALIKTPQMYHAVIALVDCSKITTDTDSGDVEATARIRHIEVVTGADRDQVEKMLHDTLKDRTGLDELPFEDQP